MVNYILYSRLEIAICYANEGLRAKFSLEDIGENSIMVANCVQVLKASVVSPLSLNIR